MGQKPGRFFDGFEQLLSKDMQMHRWIPLDVDGYFMIFRIIQSVS